MSFDYEKYLRNDKMPTIWCPGCGLGEIMKAAIRAVDAVGIDKNDVAMVSGIGCTSRMVGYLDFNTLHTTHGRAAAFATGIKMVKPEKTVLVVGGDGDASAIGGNHFIHACRRNIDMTYIVSNNLIYGMTGGQFSPTTPIGAKASTTPYGNIDYGFDLVKLASGAGATYVARTTSTNPVQMAKYIENGIRHKGMSVIEVVFNCHTQFGRRNKMADPVVYRKWIKDNTLVKAQAEKLSVEELTGKFVVGEFVNIDKPEYTDMYADLTRKVQAAIASKG